MTPDNHPIRKLAASLKTGDWVRAVFEEDDVVITREGQVTLDADRDPLIETGDGELYYLTLYGIPVSDLSSLEVITPAEDDVIERAARAMAAVTLATPDAWDMWVTSPDVRADYRRGARAALEAAGVNLPPEPLPPEPLPVHQVRRQPGTEYAWQKYPQGWRCALLYKRISDDDVRSWPVMEGVE